MFTDYSSLPVTSSELDAVDHPVYGHRRPAELLDVVAGLRAQVLGQLPESRPAAPVVVSERLPRQTREAALQQETEQHRERLGRRGRAHWAEQLAEAEFSWFESRDFAREVEGHRPDFSFEEERDPDTSWQEQLAEAELLEWLSAEAGLSELEREALARRAAGVAQPTRSDRESLARAQRRAAQALLATVERERSEREPDTRPLPAAGADFSCSPLRALALQEEEGWQRQTGRPVSVTFAPAGDWLVAAYRR